MSARAHSARVRSRLVKWSGRAQLAVETRRGDRDPGRTEPGDRLQRELAVRVRLLHRWLVLRQLVLRPAGSSYACVYPGAETECRQDLCEDGNAIAGAACAGVGSCPAPVETACGAYACEGDSCGSSCDQTSDCASGFICAGDDCVAAPDAGPPDAGSPDAAPGSPDASPSSPDAATPSDVDGGRDSDPDRNDSDSAEPRVQDFGGCNIGTRSHSAAVLSQLLIAMLVLAFARRRR
jgi:hypothetical protein